MPLQKKWSELTHKNIKKVPHKKGSYELTDRNKKIIDIGGSEVSVRNRLKKKILVLANPKPAHFRYHQAKTSSSGIKLEAKESAKLQKRNGKKPKHTKRSPRL